jgi:uncharacterized SAM-binding protein YcdF (DUF218 family)
VFFLASKAGWFLATPSNALPLLALVGAGLGFLPRTRTLGLSLVILGSLGVLVAGLTPVPDLVLAPLEARFPEFRDDGRPVAGIIVLGGAIEPGKSLARDQLLLNDAGERMIALGDLARRYPDARVVFSGGSAALSGAGTSEAEVVERFAGTLGVAPGRLAIEARSRNTHENAAYTVAQIGAKPGERWLLVTSAWHMPRAVGCFRVAGLAVTPYPVDFRTSDRPSRLIAALFASEGLHDLDLGTKEWIGLLAYRLAGYTDALLPGPDDGSGAVTGPSR